ncbi:MAG TPA: alpha/beta hydrolase [Dehalococcoidia bacterium]|nr:alpha/beta hydrolase [Dehalococcoidia bacterium]
MPHDEWANLNGLDFHYRDWDGSGQSVILIHGLASNCHIWDMVAPILARDFAVVAMDQRGHGESAKPDHGYDFDTVGSDLSALINHLGLVDPVLVGHSWGGDVVLELAVACPGLAKGLVFVDGGMINSSARYASLDDAREQMAPPNFKGWTVEEFSKRVREGQLGSLMTGQIEEIVLANFEVLPDGTIRARLSRDNHIRIIEALWDHHPPELYPGVTCPVLVMPARQKSDPATAGLREIRENSVATSTASLPKGEVVWLEDSIHDVPLQRPELVASIIAQHIQSGFFD